MSYSVVDKLNATKFPLSIFVIFIHTDLNLYKSSEDLNFAFLFSNVLGRIAVPSFLIISGYLYFYKVPNAKFTLEMWKNKTKRRLSSLVVPYILWNIIYVLYCWIRPTSVPIFNFFNCFFGELFSDNVYYPANGPLWFLRDLFFISLLSPIIWSIIKYIPVKWYSVFILILLLIPSNFIMHNLYECALYFSIGAFLVYHKIDFLQISKKHYYLSFVACLVSMICSYIHFYPFDFCGRFLILCRIPFILMIISYFPVQIKNISFINLSMFFFLSHYMIRSVGFSVSRYMIGIDSGIVGFCINSVMTIFVCTIIFCLINTFFPKFLLFSIGKVKIVG